MPFGVVPLYGALSKSVDFGDAIEEGGEAAVGDGVDVSVLFGSIGAVDGGDFADERVGHGH